MQRAFWRQSDRKEGNEVKFIPFFYAYFTDSSKCDKIEAKQKIISKLSDDILDKLRDYLSSLDTLEDKVNG